MSRKPTKSVSIKVHKDGSMTLRSTGGVDLRKVVPQFFPPADDGLAGVRRVRGSEIHVGAHLYGSSSLIDGNKVFFRIAAADRSRASIYSADQSTYICEAICPELCGKRVPE
ncbi:Mu transposase C-terminal domain-containing protein [Rhizobium sp. 18055]|uniref:Mu transposase C-terminal domain-containing protein n=1 Tax=Rhizobium sp. 18055 TaxID=2681403 RepID=UPI0013593B26|nr:Mu transposase C-terminal domain-containing protein [Rhizobium sp. 18055]